MKRDDEDDARWTDELPATPEHERAALHLRRVPAPAALTAAQIARIRARLDEAQPPQRRWWASWRGPALALGATAVAALAIVALRGARPVEEATARRVSVPACAHLTLADEEGRRVDLAGPGEASLVNARALVLDKGRLSVRAGDKAVTIDSARARVTVRPRATAEVMVQPSRTVVAAFAGSVVVEWRETGRTVELPAGYSTTAEAAGSTPPTRHAEVDRLRTDGPPVPAECTPVAATAPVPAPPVLAIAPTPPPRREPAARARPMVTPAAPSVAAAPPVASSTTLAPPESALSVEQRLLATALRHLRERDGAGALAALDQHHERFPDGVLLPESAVLRVDALLQLGRRAAAADHLEAMTLDGLPRARELHLVRGELGAELGRCERALSDFDVTLTGRSDSLEERALFGRASCHARRGDFSEARADLSRYLERFPDGKFAADARRELQRR